MELAELQRLTKKTLRFPSPSGFLRLAKALFANGQTKAAAQVCVKSMHAFPRSPGAYLLLATLMQRQRMIPRAIETLVAGHSRNPDNAEICIQLAQIYLSREQQDLGARFLVRAEKLDPSNNFVHEQLQQLDAELIASFRQQGSSTDSDDAALDKLVQQPGVRQALLIDREGRTIHGQHAGGTESLDVDLIGFLSKEFLTRANQLAASENNSLQRFVIQAGQPAIGSIHAFVQDSFCLTVIVTGEERPALIELLARPALEHLLARYTNG